MVEVGQLVSVEFVGGPANGQHRDLPAVDGLPPEQVQIDVDNWSEALVHRLEYRRDAISDTSHRWTYRPV